MSFSLSSSTTLSSSTSPSFPQFSQDFLSKNDSVLQFLSPPVRGPAEQGFVTFLQLDRESLELKSFDYHPDPTFNKLDKNIITEASIINVTVTRGERGGEGRDSLPTCFLLAPLVPIVTSPS